MTVLLYRQLILQLWGVLCDSEPLPRHYDKVLCEATGLKYTSPCFSPGMIFIVLTSRAILPHLRCHIWQILLHLKGSRCPGLIDHC
jgi:hypothetical protein